MRQELRGMLTGNLMQIKVVPHEMGACYLTAIRHRYILDIMDEVSLHHHQLQTLLHMAGHRYKLTANIQQVRHGDQHVQTCTCCQQAAVRPVWFKQCLESHW